MTIAAPKTTVSSLRMPRPRKELVRPAQTRYYHCISRCVRRAFLCGHDRFTGQSYEHRREWIVERMRLLSTVFAIDVYAYAVMSDHYHLVVHIGDASELDTNTVIARWLQLYQGPLLARRYRGGDTLSAAEYETVIDMATVWRRRLGDLSWFMKCLNEPIARQANLEDQCTGHFWEARFKSQALINDEALVACMAYVDLNPIRAGIARTPETSDFTSVQERAHLCANRADKKPGELAGAAEQNKLDCTSPEHNTALMPVAGGLSGSVISSADFPLKLLDYLKLVDHLGRQQDRKKRGRIPSALPPLLRRLGLSEVNWQDGRKAYTRRHRQRSARLA